MSSVPGHADPPSSAWSVQSAEMPEDDFTNRMKEAVKHVVALTHGGAYQYLQAMMPTAQLRKDTFAT